MPSFPNVAIIGAGPAGCVLARLLLDAAIPVTVFEGDAFISIRAQGGTLDLHPETGQKALKEAGLYQEFVKHARYEGEAFAVVDKRLKAYIKIGGTTDKTSRGRPEIDRASLRQILVDSLPDGVIRWSSRLRSVDSDDLSLHFDHGIERDFDLVVGADGAWSKVRPVLSSTKPYYAGVGGIDMSIENAEESQPEISKLVNRGSVFASSDGKTIMLQQKGDASIIVYAWAAMDEEWMTTSGYDVHKADEVKRALRKDYADWDPLLIKATQVANDRNMVARSLYILPVGHRWENKPGVTLIGDAAHLMTPFAGEGVNLAMEDAMKLAHAIIESTKLGANPKALGNCIRPFELEMFARATPIANVSKLNMEDMLFTPGAPKSTIHSYIRRSIVGDGWLVSIFLPLWLVRLLLRLIFWW